MPLNYLKKFEESGIGILTRYLLILTLAGVLFLADQRYPTRVEIEKKERQLHAMRAEDLADINRRIIAVTSNNSENLDRIGGIDNRLSRIEAQNEIIIRALEKIQNGN